VITADVERVALQIFNMPLPDQDAVRGLASFARAVGYERALLAMTDPVGELEAVRPLGRVTARGIALMLTERSSNVVHMRVSRADFDQRTILDRLGADPDATRGVIRCPAHEDRHPSLSWRVDGGKVLLHCFRGCTFDEIRAAA
jgi:hypothetical protein